MLDKKKFVIYPSLNTHPLKIPERSVLSPLEPIGIGTAYCESLISYITRLAYEHCVSPQKLINEVINKQLNISTGLISNQDNLLDFILKLDLLTYKSNLHCLTLLNWSKIIKPFKLYKKFLSWCPLCYEQWKQQGQNLYLPIIWLISGVEICRIHNHILLQKCFECGYLLKSVASQRVKIGYCPKCKAWLGCNNSCEFNTTDYQDTLSIYPLTQQYIIKNLSDLIVATPTVNYCVLPERLGHILRNSAFLAKIRLDGLFRSYNNCQNEFLQEINLPFVKFRAYYQSKYVTSVPSLITLLKITHYCQISLIDFLFKDFESLILEINKNIPLPQLS